MDEDPPKPPCSSEPVGVSIPPPPGSALPPFPAPAVPPAPPAPMVGAPPPVTIATTTRWRPLRGLVTALTVMLVLDALGAALGTLAFAARIGVLDDIINGRLDPAIVQRARDADDFVAAASAILVFLTVVTVVLWLIWNFRAAKNNEALGRDLPRWKPGWAIGGWFIPLANFVIPVMVLQDLWRGSSSATPRGDARWRGNPGSALIGWYWGFWVASTFRLGFGRTGARLSSVTQLRSLRSHDAFALFGMVMTIVAAILAIQVVRGITRRQEACLQTQQSAWARGTA